MEQNLSQYRIFFEVAKAGNISKAAKILYISQPAISKAISKLEDGLGITLFLRNSRGVSLTMEGQVLYEHIARAFDSIYMAEKQLDRIKNFNMGKLSIGTSNTVCKHVMLDYLKNFVNKYPHVMLSISTQSSLKTTTMIEDDLLDLGLVVSPAYKKSLNFHPIREVHDIFVATPEYINNLRLREGDDVDLFSAGNVMLLDRSNATRTHVDSYLNMYGIQIRQLLEVTNLDLLIEFSKIGIGIGCVIKEFVLKEIEEGSLIEVPLPTAIPTRQVGFAYLHSNPNPMLKVFLENKK